MTSRYTAIIEDYIMAGQPLAGTPLAVGQAANGHPSILFPHQSMLISFDCMVMNNKTAMKAVPASRPPDKT